MGNTAAHGKCINRLRQKREECAGVKRRSARGYILQNWHASCCAVQLINKWRDYHVFTDWHVCLNHSVLLPISFPTWLLYSSLYSLSFSLSRSTVSPLGQSDRLMCLLDWLSLLAPLLFSFAYTASICQAVSSLAQSTLLGPPQRHSPWSPCSPDMSRGRWVSPSCTERA